MTVKSRPRVGDNRKDGNYSLILRLIRNDLLIYNNKTSESLAEILV